MVSLFIIPKSKPGQEIVEVYYAPKMDISPPTSPFESTAAAHPIFGILAR
jgi:hypothetical protein